MVDYSEVDRRIAAASEEVDKGNLGLDRCKAELSACIGEKEKLFNKRHGLKKGAIVWSFDARGDVAWSGFWIGASLASCCLSLGSKRGSLAAGGKLARRVHSNNFYKQTA